MFSLLGSIIIGGFAGWIASGIMKTNTGIFMNILLGIVGAFVANFIGAFVGLAAYGVIGTLIAGVAGACLLIWVGRKARS